MPLSLERAGVRNSIKKVCGNEKTRRFLETLGFIPGEVVTIVSDISGNIIVAIKDSRIAINREIANKIII